MARCAFLWIALPLLLAVARAAPPPDPLPLYIPDDRDFWLANPLVSYQGRSYPAWADILLEASNFVVCQGSYALCYYSGPDSMGLPCVPGKGKNDIASSCVCYEVPFGLYWVDINSILNYDVWEQTVAECGADGSNCNDPTAINAPVCDYIKKGTFNPGADSVSAFSLRCVPADGIGQTSCQVGTYAGCMTAACTATDNPGYVDCACPNYDGLFEIGTFNQQCDIDPNVWSAAHAVGASNISAITEKILDNFPHGCLPDVPGGLGCPLYKCGSTDEASCSPDNDPPPKPPKSVCDAVCAEYEGCLSPEGVEIAFTCDATLCTTSCEDLAIAIPSCQGLGNCSVSATLALEVELGCSCCASQVCRCTSSPRTDEALRFFNAQQNEQGTKTQCDLTGSLCGDGFTFPPPPPPVANPAAPPSPNPPPAPGTGSAPTPAPFSSSSSLSSSLPILTGALAILYL